MKLLATLAAGALGAGAIVASPAAAQYYGHDHGGYGYHHGYGYGHRYGYHGRDGYRGGYGYRRPYYRHGFYGRGYGYGHRRIVCRIHRGYGGPVRRCFPVY